MQPSRALPSAGTASLICMRKYQMFLPLCDGSWAPAKCQTEGEEIHAGNLAPEIRPPRGADAVAIRTMDVKLLPVAEACIGDPNGTAWRMRAQETHSSRHSTAECGNTSPGDRPNGRPPQPEAGGGRP